MTDSISTRTKTITESNDTESTQEPLIVDRWTNNISYTQLVISSCIGIVQLWWHPYIYDFRRLLPFVFLYNIFSIFLVYPIFYLELAIGIVTKKGVLNCWDMAPVARGVGFSMLISCVFTALALGAVSAWCLALLVHSLHSFLPWLHCAAIAQPPCAARHRPLPPGSETPAQSFFFNFVLKLKRDDLSGGFGNIVSELTVYYIISWMLVYLVVCKRIYSYSKMVLFKDVLAFLVLVCSAVGVFRLNGAGIMLVKCDWSVIFESLKMWREALDYAFIQTTVSQGTLIMLGAYCPKRKHSLAKTAFMAFAISKITCTASALILGAAHGVLYTDYDNTTTLWKGKSSAMILWADYAARVPGSQFWSALIFFTLFVLSISSTGLLVQTIMSTFTGRCIRKITWVFLVLICVLFCFTGVITLCTQGGMYILDFLMSWPVSKLRAPIGAVMAVVITYSYGQTTFCEDVYFSVGEYPCVLFRVCWAVTPVMMMFLFLSGMVSWPTAEVVAGWTLVTLALLPTFIIMFLYLIFKFRVRNIVSDEK